MELAVLITLVVIALAFDYTNGFHDAANAIATSVSTRALTPRVALILAAIMNFIGALIGTEVAHTVADTIGSISGTHGLVIVLGALVGAITWNLITWYFGLPSSSSHALIGGLVGAGLVGGATVNWVIIKEKVIIPMVVSPIIGFTLAFLLMLAFTWILRRRNPYVINRRFKVLQVFSAAALALGHGLQDAQKTMGVILIALVTYDSSKYDIDHLPMWVILGAAGAISLGTYSGGWRIMRTIGRKIIKLDPPSGFAAESVATSVLYVMALHFKAPVSTTHTITSAVMGAGATRGKRAVQWNMAGSIVMAWILTFPCAGLVAAAAYGVLKVAFGV
ncbi:inorganic phosphate transporter [Nocardioides phosphati]|uniref:Inorganic phosphate transporter n=1 Tax=Nocardioides phosphati TaxID=1867775 RepID=A0ABQ2NG44_9ACTN|nr:inorganic phosphate transporter [Nocardioides phosphati]GGO93657.1 inorganic phosphate transporter [Nocardioides phosphati]